MSKVKEYERPSNRQGRGGFGGGPGFGMPAEKPKKFKSSLIRLMRYLHAYRLKLNIVIFTAILSTVFSITGPKILGLAITKLYAGVTMKIKGIPNARIDFDYIMQILLILIGLYLLSAIFGYIQQYIMSSVAQETVFDMRNDVSNKLNKLPLKYFDAKTHGEILSRVTNDIDTISTTLQQSVTQIITAIIQLIGYIIMMLTISPLMTLLMILTLPLYIVVTKLIAKQSQKYFSNQQKLLGQLNGHVEEMFTGHKIVKAFVHEQKSVSQFKEINEKLYQAGFKAQFISGIIMPLMFFINNIGYVIVCVVGGIFVAKERILLGDIQAFITYSRQFTHPIVQTANIANVLQSTIAAAERVFEVLDEEEEQEDNKDAITNIKPKGNVKFDNVVFGYSLDRVLIENMNLEIMKGQTVAIVGPTGAGKTTLVNLLMRFYETQEGSILVDGIDIKDMRRTELRQIFGMVLQDTWLFSGTISENIGYGKVGATHEEIIEAARAAHADHFIRTLPGGYETQLNEEASNISAGQKQLITIARAILANPTILILDEATSSVDTRTEIQIQKAMNKLMIGRTSFVIAHRLSTIKEADLILVMNEGSVIEKGNHKSLLEANGFYSELYYSQFTTNLAI